MTLESLKSLLQDKLELVNNAIEQYGGSHEITLKQNSYWCGGEYLATYKGFVDFTDFEEEEEWDDED